MQTTGMHKPITAPLDAPRMSLLPGSGTVFFVLESYIPATALTPEGLLYNPNGTLHDERLKYCLEVGKM